jgi:hypothetical protein
MVERALAVGAIVANPRCPNWGPGKVLTLEGAKAKVYFRDLFVTKLDEGLKTMQVSSLALAGTQSDDWLDHLPPFTDGKFKSETKPVTFDQAVKSFVNRYPLRFDDPKYLENERDYKWDAHTYLATELTPWISGSASVTSDIARLTEIGISGAAVKVNLLSQYEQMALRDGLKDQAAARTFFERLFDLVKAPAPDDSHFAPYIEAVESLPAESGRARVATWPILTIMPYLIAPDRFMFLKPEVTKKAADRLLFDLLYSSKLSWATYSRLLKMSQLLINRLRPLGARDYIDVQSFIFLTGE